MGAATASRPATIHFQWRRKSCHSCVLETSRESGNGIDAEYELRPADFPFESAATCGVNEAVFSRLKKSPCGVGWAEECSADPRTSSRSLSETAATNLYPNPTTVSMYLGATGSSPRWLRRRFTAVLMPLTSSTVLESFHRQAAISSRVIRSLRRSTRRRSRRICYAGTGTRTPRLRSSLRAGSSRNGPNSKTLPFISRLLISDAGEIPGEGSG